MATAIKEKERPAVQNQQQRPSEESPPRSELTVVDMSADAGAGMEGASADSFAIPFLIVLQKGSPQVDETSGAAIEGARQGMFFENVTSKLFDGKTGVTLIPCAYKRVFVRWAGRDAEGGFKGEFTAEKIAEMREKGQVVEMDGRLFAPLADGSVNEKKSDRFSDTRNHYCLLIDPNTGFTTQVLLSLSSTQIKKSKALMSMLASVKKPGPNGLFTPPTFGLMVRATTIPESNEKGSWMGIKFDMAGDVSDPYIYQAAKAFNQSVARGAVAANYEATAEEPVARGGF